jgi:hypothetical protein
MYDNCDVCETRRYIDAPLPIKAISSVACKNCGFITKYVWCNIHHKICRQNILCGPMVKPLIPRVKPLIPKTPSELVQMCHKIDNIENKLNLINDKLQKILDMVDFLPGEGEKYMEAKADFEKQV